MTKFEEEVKRPDNTGIDPFSKRDVDFSKLAEKFTRGAQTLKNWRNYADYKEHQLEQKDEQIQSLAKMVDKLNGQNVNLKGELEETRDLQCETSNQAVKEYIDRCEAESKLKELKSHCEKLENENSFLRDECTTFDSNGNSVEPIITQQALPVVPECVGIWIKKCKELNWMITDVLAPESWSSDFAKDTENWLKKSKENFNLLALAFITGKYQVEKPQLCKLIFPNSTAVLQKDGELNSFADTVYKRYLMENAMTEQEIKSIDERYWQFAVPVEDGE